MGTTPRQHEYMIPLHTRASDVTTLTKCVGQWFLAHFYESIRADATYLIIGQAVHQTIETAVSDGLPETWALQNVANTIGTMFDDSQAAGRRMISTKTKPADRERLLAAGGLLIRNWYRQVHPGSDERLGIYDDYEWPPRVEVAFHAGDVWGTIDAVFDHKDGGGKRAYVDWKTGQRKSDSYQMHHYVYGSGADPNLTETWFHHLNRPRATIQYADVYPGHGAVAAVVAAAAALKRSVLADPAQTVFATSTLCNYCAVQEYCPVEGWGERQLELAAYEDMVLDAEPFQLQGG